SKDPRAVLQPKLRMIANGSASVNLLRAEQMSALTVPKPPPLKGPMTRGNQAVPMAPGRRRKPPKFYRVKPAKNVLANVFVDLAEGADAPRDVRLGKAVRRGTQMSGSVPVADLVRLATDPS